MLILYWISTFGTHLIRAMTMFRPSLVGRALCTIIALALITVRSVLHINEFKYAQQNGESSSGNTNKSTNPLMMLFLSPAIYTISYAWSGRDKDKHTSLLKAYGIFFAVLMFETVVASIYVFVILPYFFLASTPTLTRFLLRMFGQVFFFCLGSELSWRCSKHAAEHMGAKVFDATVASFGWYASVIPFFQRTMQGSAETVLHSIIYEIPITLAELTLADAFLKSRTPIGDTVHNLKSVLGGKKSNKVSPAKTRLSLTGVDS